MMSFKSIIGSFLMCWLCSSCQSKQGELWTIQYASKAEAEKLIVAHDDFSTNLNQYDLNLRLQKTGATKDEWEALVRQETMEWTPEEMARVQMAFDTLKSNMAKMELELPIPPKVVMLKTSMREEMGAGGYTRSNWIAIGANELKRATDAQLTRLVAHELFHVMSRHDADFKKKVYGIFGFVSTNHEIEFAKDAQDKRITNPDIAKRDSYISLELDGKKQNFVEYIYADHAFTGGDIFDCLRVGFIPLDAQMQPLKSDSGTVIYPITELADAFEERIGRNTDYVIDPEEISAEHFSMMLTCAKNLPNPEFIEKMKSVLKEQ